METFKFFLIAVLFSVTITQVQSRVVKHSSHEGKGIKSDVTAHRDPSLHNDENRQNLHLINAAKTESMKLLKRLKDIDRKVPDVRGRLQKFKDDITSLRQHDKMSQPLYKSMFAEIETLKKALKEEVVGFVDPFRPLSKIPTNGYYLDDVTDVDNAEYQLKKIMAAMRQLAKKVKEVIQSASDRENKFEDIARLFQWAVKLSLEAKQVHQSVTSLKQLMREKTGEEALDASEAKKLSKRISDADDKLLKDIELPLHHFEPLDKPPTVAYPRETETTLANVQNALIQVKQDLVEIGDAALRVLYDSSADDSQDGIENKKSAHRRTMRETDMDGTLIQLGESSMRKLRDSEDKDNEDDEMKQASWRTTAAVGALMAMFGILLGFILATICYLYKREINRDPYRFRKSQQKLPTTDMEKKEGK